jgi:cytoskeletal protein CcmA (bactofilin family)
MFEKKDDSQKEQERVKNETISSIIDKKMLIAGDIAFQGKTSIDSTINGNITACSFNGFGKLEGNVRVYLGTAWKNCVTHGRLEDGSLTVEPGAVIDREIRAAIGEITTSPVKKPTMDTAPISGGQEQN